MKKLTDRKDIAQALNFGKYPVLSYDLDAKKGCTANVIKKTIQYGERKVACQLYRGQQTEDDGVFYLLSGGTMLSAKFDVDDFLDRVDKANAPVIKPETDVAIACYSKRTGEYYVCIVNSGKVAPDYSDVATFS